MGVILDAMGMGRKVRKDVTQVAEGQVAANPNVVNLLAPVALEEGNADMRVNASARRMMYVSDYQPEVRPDWARSLFGERASVTTFLLRPTDRARLARSIDNADARHGVALVQGGSASNMDEEQRARDHGRMMLALMGDDGERFYDTCVLQCVAGEDDEDLRRAAKSLSSKTGNGQSLTMSTCVTKQLAAWYAASPYWYNGEEAWERWGRDLPVSTIAAALPFQDNSVDDGTGVDLGWCEPDHSICRIDMTRTAPDRSNCNVWVSGSSGMGKTYASIKVLQHEYAMGAAVIAIDPERQLSGLCRMNNGFWVNAGGGVTRKGRKLSGYCFSPLQPRVGIAGEDDDADGDAGAGVLRATLYFFHAWAELAWSTTPDDTALMDDGLLAAYARYGVDMDTSADELEPDGYPLMSDVAECLEALAEGASDEHDRRGYSRLAKKARQCCEGGAYGNLWGHRTNVDISNDFVVFDTYELTDAEEHIRTAQLFSILSWTWSRACVSRVTRQFLRVFADEGHLLFGGGTERGTSVVAASYVNMIQKRIRKYNGGLMFATQQLGDALAPEVRRYGEALITSSTYKLYFGTNATDLELLSSVAKLTPDVERRIGSKFKVGDCLVVAGNTRVQAHVEPLRFLDEMLSGGR